MIYELCVISTDSRSLKNLFLKNKVTFLNIKFINENYKCKLAFININFPQVNISQQGSSHQCKFEYNGTVKPLPNNYGDLYIIDTSPIDEQFTWLV